MTPVATSKWNKKRRQQILTLEQQCNELNDSLNTQHELVTQQEIQMTQLELIMSTLHNDLKHLNQQHECLNQEASKLTLVLNNAKQNYKAQCESYVEQLATKKAGYRS